MSTSVNQSLNCQYPDRFIAVRDSKMHYVDKGVGEPIIFLHGIPTFSYLWRNIIPTLAAQARCIAPDLIGMGFSDKPDINYRVFDHIDYIEDFIEALDLPACTLVMHGWGSVIGFALAARHPQKIKGLAFLESHIRPIVSRDMLSLPVQQIASLLSRPGAGYRAIVQHNYLVDKLLPGGAVRQISPEALAMYQSPYPTPESRRPLWQYTRDLPLGNGPDDVLELIADYSAWLQKTPIPKLMFYAVPGFITTMDTVDWAQDHLPNLQLEPLEEVLHFAQETVPEQFSEILQNWYTKKIFHQQHTSKSVV